MTNNDYIDDLYNDKLTSYTQEPFLIRYRNMVINRGEFIKSHYLNNNERLWGFRLSSMPSLMSNGYIDPYQLEDVCEKWNIPINKMNYGHHILEYIKRTADDSIDTNDFYLCEYVERPDVAPYMESVFYYKRS